MLACILGSVDTIHHHAQRIIKGTPLELLVVISHPGQAIRPVESIAADLARLYDKAYASTATKHTLALPHATVVLLKWEEDRLGWSSWHKDEHGTLATAGLPLLCCPPDSPSAMLTPAKLSQLVRDPGQSAELGFCGGYFVAAHADPQGVIQLVTNYLAEVPLYRAAKDGLTVWSNKAAAAALLAGVEQRLSHQAASEFIILSHCLENRSLWHGVELEPPATRITISQAGHQSQPYINLPAAYFAHQQPKDQAAAQTVQAMGPLIEAMRDSGDEIRVHLTGGQDSRAVSAMCRHYGFRPLCITHGTPNEEVPSAKRLTKFLGLPYRTVDGHVPPLETFMSHTQPCAWQCDGLMSLKYLAGRYDLPYIRDEGYLPVEGLGGEYGRAYYFGTDASNAAVTAGRLDPVFGKALSDRKRWWPNGESFEQTRHTIELLLTQAQDNGLSPHQTTTWFYVNQKMRRWATARRNVGWTWVVDPLQMPCWTYRGMSAPPQDKRDDELIRAAIEAAWPGTTAVPTVPQLAYAARRRRIASNRIVRTAMKWYDRALRPAEPVSWQTQTLISMRKTFSNLIEDMGQYIDPVIPARHADTLLDQEPWSYDQTEMYWHTLTVANWCKAFLHSPPPIQPCHAKTDAVPQR